MNESFALDDRRLRTAMEVLEREQQAFLPSRSELFRFRLFNWAVALFVVLLFAVFLDEALKLNLRLPDRLAVSVAFFVLTPAAAILFLLNIPLIRKLWRQGRLRRRLGLKRELKSVFKRERRTLRGAINAIVGVIFTLLAAIFLVLFVTFVYQWLSDPAAAVEDWGRLGVILFGLMLFFIPLSLVSLPLMQRSKRRFEIVTNLQQTLATRQSGLDARGRGAEISPGAVQMIAEIEREQIIDDRRRSLRLGLKKGQAPDYTIQQSRAVQQAKAQLDSDSARKLEDAVFALMGDPRPPGLSEDPETGFNRLRIPEAPFEIVYQVDEETRRIKVFDLRPSDAPDAGAAGHA